jgi:hypothetical protein
MSDEFPDHDTDTPTEADLESMYGTRFLSTGDIGTRRIRTKIKKVGKEELRNDKGIKRGRFLLSFASLDKQMVVNQTTMDLLVAELGRVPSQWVGASVGIFVDPNVMFGGKRVGGIRLRILEAFQAKKPAPVPKKPAVTEWPDESGDPGFDPDDVPDFDQAAE